MKTFILSGEEGSSFAHLRQVRPGKARGRCSGALYGRGARLGMAAAAALAIHPSPSIRSFLHDDGDEAADHDEALEEVRPHHRPQTALQRKPQK